MKICAIISEFNPFHNGHKYLIEQAKKLSKCDAILCIMSGDFTQRGEICIFDKYVRARHAVWGGADCVIQLPTPFAVAPAEIFAKGALKILSSIPDVACLAFGCECGNERELITSAKILLDESDEFRRVLNENLLNGESYIKSYTAAFEASGGKKGLTEKPNNVLALEYTKAILRSKADIEILPVKRIGAGYNDEEMKVNFSSASAIRKNIANIDIKNNVPEFVFNDLGNAVGNNEFYSRLRHSLFLTDADELEKLYGGGEGLGNKLKSLENEPLENIIKKATSRRYSSSRIKRMLCANALGLHALDCEKFLKGDLYIQPLAVRKTCADELLSSLAKSQFPVICGIDTKKLTPSAKECFEKDRFEFRFYNSITNSDKKDYMITI